MLLTNRNALLGLTLIAALGIGFVMQMTSATRTAETPPEPLEVTDITLTASLVAPMDVPSPASLPTAPARVAAEADAPVAVDVPADTPAPEFACEITMEAAPRPAAMVELALNADCLPNERVTFHHNGMMFSDTTDAKGLLTLTVPALSAKAVFIASFPSGDGAVAQIDVASLRAYDRIVVQWRGSAGLELHAREYDADYWTDGHIWADAPGSTHNTAAGDSGLLTRLGRADAAEPLLAEVYTFPTRMAERPGAVHLSVEAEVTATNCGNQVDAQTLEYRQSETLKVQDLTLFMPECDATGDFLVLKNLLEDLKIAAK